MSGWRGWKDAAAVALLTVADFAAFTLMLMHLVSQYQHEHNDVGTNVNFFLGSDLATPMVGWVWFLILLNGAVLCARRRTRTAGVGVLVAASVVAIPVVAWVAWSLATFSSG